jgi:hypothetical protein
LTSFFAIDRYSPLLVLATGLFTFIGLWGLGTALLIILRMRFASPWNHVTALLLGIQGLSLLVQITGMTGIASLSVLSAIWWALVTTGTVMLLIRSRQTLVPPISTYRGLALLPFIIVAIAVALNALVALAPSTKIDELYYHMLVPSRIVSDSALHFYREPWQAAILPHMIFQISEAPTHAIGYPDAANVVSWALSATLVWFAWRIIRANGKPVNWAALWVGSLCVGIYPVVWDVTGGAHAMGDLAMVAAIVTFGSRESLLKTLAPSAYGAMLSIFLLSAAASKISLLPLSATLLCVAAWPLLRTAPPPVGRQVALAFAAPWIIFYCPILIWTWVQSGSPFGPVLAGAIGTSIYPVGWAQEIFRESRVEGQGSLITMIQHSAVSYSPLVWLGVIGALVGSDLSRATRVILGLLLALQFTLVYWLLPYDARYLGGLHFGLLILFATYARRDIQDRFGSVRTVTAGCLIFLLPWLGIQAYYAKQFLPVSVGLENSAFYERYVAFYADFVKLDRLLSKDTVLLVDDFRLDAVYAPRPVFFDSADLPQGKSAVLFASPETIKNIRRTFGGFKLGDVIYENAQAVTETYRTPGRRPTIGALQVVRIVGAE